MAAMRCSTNCCPPCLPIPICGSWSRATPTASRSRLRRYPSNWELSTGRAASVARYLIEHGVAPQRVQASGYADTRPLGSKDNLADRAANRRVELILEKVKPGA
ncbi:MAG: OmpA family protein [Burkholderiaceae bacterium]